MRGATPFTGIGSFGQLPEVQSSDILWANPFGTRVNVSCVELLYLLVSELSGRCPNKKRPAEAGLVGHCGAMYCLVITGVAYTQQNFRAGARKKDTKKGPPEGSPCKMLGD
jgi:hypothetical protein